MSICSVDGCEGLVNASGLCGKHYMQMRRAGKLPIGTRARGTITERFWSLVQPVDGCWNWAGNTGGKGYGRIGAGGRGGKYLLAHRVSYEIHHGAIAPGMVVMHKCDNPSCVNPDHLRLGTTAENVKDAYEKRRKVSPFKLGADHHGSVLTEAKVRFIRDNPALPLRHLAALCGCASTTVSQVRSGKTWKHIT